MLGYHRTT